MVLTTSAPVAASRERNSIPSKEAKLRRVATHSAKTVKLNEHRVSGSVALGGKPKLQFVHLAIAAPTPNSGFAVRGR